MASLLGAGVLVMIVADAVVGARLVRLSLRTRRLPELALGASLIFLGGVGYPLAVAARNGVAGSPEATAELLALALACQNLGCASLAVATAGTFRAGVAWARGLASLLGCVLLGSWLVQVATGDFAQPAGSSLSYWAGFVGRVLPFLWSAAESWRTHARLRRQLRVGLGDAAVTDRVRLWATSATGVVLAFGVFLCGLVSGADVATSPWVLAPTSLAGCVSGITLWLAFLPPERYLRRFQLGSSGSTP